MTDASLSPWLHRASAAAIVFAPLGHHTFDATHVSFGVLTGGIAHGRWGFEGSVFNGREPDQHRWNFDLAAPDSVSGRVWFHPSDEWASQVSTGHLVQPEQLERGNLVRTTASASWTRARPASLSAMTVASHQRRRASTRIIWIRSARSHSERFGVSVDGVDSRPDLA